MGRALRKGLGLIALCVAAGAQGSTVEVVELETAGEVRQENGSNTHWESLAIEELLALFGAGAAPAASIELGAETGGSWDGGTAYRIAPDALELAQPHNVAVTLSLLQAGDGALGYYTEAGDPASGGLVFEDLSGTQLQAYVKLGSVKDELYFTLLEETETAGAYEVVLASEFHVDDFLMYAIPDNRYLFMSIDADPTTDTFLDLAFKVDIGRANADMLIAASGGIVAAAPLPPLLWAAFGVVGVLGGRRRVLRRLHGAGG